MTEVSSTLPDDIGKGLSALAALVSGVAHGTATFDTVFTTAEAVQKVAAGLGLEPPEVVTMINAAEFFVPLVKELYTSGAVTGGMPSGWVAGGGPGLRRGQILP